MGLRDSESLALLDALTPPSGWHTDVALLSTYSVDLVAVAAVVLALGGEGDDHEQMQRVGLARACDALTGRVRVLCQAGRVAVPKATGPLLSLADRWIREQRVSGDATQGNWHAKLAIVRQLPDQEPAPGEPAERWLFWTGSRNLTQDTSWDTGLLAIGTPRPPGVSASPASADIASIGRELATRAALTHAPPDRFADALSQLSWQWPAEVLQVHAVSLWPLTRRAPGALPKLPANTRSVLGVSPFLDVRVGQQLLALGGDTTHRTLLSTEPALGGLHHAKGVDLTAFDGLYALEPADLSTADTDALDEDLMRRMRRGLHAKMLLITSAAGAHDLWLGSANLTRRGWSGDNVELMVHMRVHGDIPAGLTELCANRATALHLDPTLRLPKPPDPDPLDPWRVAIAAAFDAQLRPAPAGAFQLHLAAALPRPPFAHRLTVSMLGDPRAIEIPAGARLVTLPPVPLARRTELVVLTLRTEDEHSSWVARAPMNPPPSAARDHAVLAQLMGPRALLAWLRGLLDGQAPDDGSPPWPDRKPSKSGGGGGAGRHTRAAPPSFEQLLRAWTRDPTRLAELDRVLSRWAERTAAASAEAPPESVAGDDDPLSAAAQDPRAVLELKDFLAMWRRIRGGFDLAPIDGAAP